MTRTRRVIKEQLTTTSIKITPASKKQKQTAVIICQIQNVTNI